MTHDLGILLLAFCPRELKSRSQRHALYSTMVTAELLTIGKTQKQPPNCVPIDIHEEVDKERGVGT